jgi:hypothetical protein
MSDKPSTKKIGRPPEPVADRLAKLVPLFDAAIEEITRGAFPRKTLEKYKIGHNAETFLRKNYDAFEHELARASEAGAAAMAERLVDIASEHDNPAMARVVSQNMQWYLERVHRKAYAPSVDVNINQQISISGALSEARARINRPEIDLQDVVDAEIVEESSTYAIGAPDYESVAPIIPDRNGLLLAAKPPDKMPAGAAPDIFG